jgi:CHC2 zinc finger
MMVLSRFNPRELKRNANFIAIVSRYTKLRRAGHQYAGLCPFHNEREPSFYIEPRRKIWKCFGCDAGGDVLDFIMLAEDCSFAETLRVVAGVARESEPRSGERFRARVGGEAPSAREAGVTHSPNTRASILVRLAETERRNAIICAANETALAEFATACEPERGFLLLVNKRITGHE